MWHQYESIVSRWLLFEPYQTCSWIDSLLDPPDDEEAGQEEGEDQHQPPQELQASSQPPDRDNEARIPENLTNHILGQLTQPLLNVSFVVTANKSCPRIYLSVSFNNISWQKYNIFINLERQLNWTDFISNIIPGKCTLSFNFAYSDGTSKIKFLAA